MESDDDDRVYGYVRIAMFVWLFLAMYRHGCELTVLIQSVR